LCPVRYQTRTRVFLHLVHVSRFLLPPSTLIWLWAFTKDGKMIAASAAKKWNWFQAPLNSSDTGDAATSSVFHRRQHRLPILSDSGRAFYHFLSIKAATNLYITQLDFTKT
jgi:hypothetical protein